MSRPKKIITRDKGLRIRLTQEEYEMIKCYAEQHNMTMSEAIRQSVLFTVGRYGGNQINKPIDMLTDEDLVKVVHDIDIVRNMLMEELTKRVPKYDVNTGTQILKLLLYAMSGEKDKYD